MDFLAVVHTLDLKRGARASLCKSERSSSPLPPPGQIAAYLDWQQKFMAGPESARIRSYWETKLGGELPVLNKPYRRDELARSLRSVLGGERA